MNKSIYSAMTSNRHISGDRERYIKEICIAMDSIRDVFSTIEAEESVSAKFLIHKAIIIEIHKVWELSKDAGINQNVVTNHYAKNSLIILRNAICHINHQVKRETGALRAKTKTILNWETQEIAGGLAKSNDKGKTWEIADNIMVFNFELHGRDGAFTTVGQMGSYLVCQSEQGCIDLDLSASVFECFYDNLIEAVIKIRT